MASSKCTQMHAMAIPVPGQGHINPLMRFCKRLASQEAFTITFVDIDPFVDTEHESSSANTEELSKQKHDSMDAASKQLAHTRIYAHTSSAVTAEMHTSFAVAADMHQQLDIRRVRIPMETPKPRKGSTMYQSFFEALQGLAPLIEELLSRLLHEDPPITCLISDLYMTGLTQKVADKFSIPRIAFHTTNLSVLLFQNYILEGTISLEEALKVLTKKEAFKEDTFVEGLPGLPSLKNGDILDFREDNMFFYVLNGQYLKESKERAHAIVVNSVEELEEPGFRVNIGGIPIYAVGPLIEPLDKDTSTSIWKEDKDCILWLNEQPSLSVLYISFGSMAFLSKAQFQEILAGLISSQQCFLWVLRPNLVKDASSTWIADLLSKSHHKGYFIEWAPQLKVLSHQSVGGFLTQCGWNSTIEALSSGVPMLCFPYISDQFMNAKFITQEWKVGLGFQICKESGLVERDEVERVIRTLMVEEEGKIFHQNAKYFKEVIDRNCQLESTSSANIKALVHTLR